MRRVFVVLLVTSSVVGQARAQDGRSAGGSGEVVVTGTRTPERSQRSTVKTDVVTREESERRGAASVADALASQPGVQVNPGAYGYLGNVSPIQIQGFDLNRVLILEDGEPVIGDVGGAIDLSNLPTGDIERIEIVTGPTSALYGSSAIGGVVNIITSPPSRLGASGRVRLERRTRNGLLGQAGGAYRWKRAWLGIETHLFREDGVARLPDRPDRQVPDRSTRLLGARAGMSLTEDLDVRLRARWIRDEQDGASSRIAPGIGRYAIDDRSQTDRYTAHVLQTWRAHDGSSLRITVGRQWADNETASRQGSAEVGERHTRRHRMQSAEVVSTVADGPRTWVAGARGEAERFDQRIDRRESLSAGVAESEAVEVAPRTLGKAALYAQLQWRLASTLTVLPGVRFETHTQYGRSATPRLAAAWIPDDAVTLRASIGRGFRAPSAKELGFAFDHSTYGYRVIGNRDLSPETSWGTNADVTVRLNPRQTVRAGVFANWVRDLIDLDLAHGVPDGGVVQYHYSNFGRARTAGGQLAMITTTPDGFRGEIAYDYLYTRDEVNRRPLGGRPPHTLTAALRARLPWSMECSARFRAVSDAFVDTGTRSPGYETIDLRLSRALLGAASAYLGALNVTDTHQDPRRSGDLRPPLGRTLYVGVKADLPLEEDE